MTTKKKFSYTLGTILIGVGLWVTGTAPLVGLAILSLTMLFWGYQAYFWTKTPHLPATEKTAPKDSLETSLEKNDEPTPTIPSHITAAVVTTPAPAAEDTKSVLTEEQRKKIAIEVVKQYYRPINPSQGITYNDKAAISKLIGRLLASSLEELCETVRVMSHYLDNTTFQSSHDSKREQLVAAHQLYQISIVPEHCELIIETPREEHLNKIKMITAFIEKTQGPDYLQATTRPGASL